MQPNWKKMFVVHEKTEKLIMAIVFFIISFFPNSKTAFLFIKILNQRNGDHQFIKEPITMPDRVQGTGTIAICVLSCAVFCNICRTQQTELFQPTLSKIKKIRTNEIGFGMVRTVKFIKKRFCRAVELFV